MKITDDKSEEIDKFLNEFRNFLLSKTKSIYYKSPTEHKPGGGVIELADGSLVDEYEESPFVLDNEFEQFIIERLAGFFGLMSENVGQKLFGFAERTLHEYFTHWVFLFVKPSIDEGTKLRLKTILFAGHHKFFDEDKTKLEKYLAKKSEHLSPTDLKALQTDVGSKDYFNRLWDIVKTARNIYGEELYHSYLLHNTDYQSILSHQHMRIHANPLALNELLGNFEIAARHRILLLFYSRQILDYFDDDKEAEKLKSKYDNLLKGLIVEI